jgi:hypothetical protein
MILKWCFGIAPLTSSLSSLSRFSYITQVRDFLSMGLMLRPTARHPWLGQLGQLAGLANLVMARSACGEYGYGVWGRHGRSVIFPACTDVTAAFRLLIRPASIQCRTTAANDTSVAA